MSNNKKTIGFGGFTALLVSFLWSLDALARAGGGGNYTGGNSSSGSFGGGGGGGSLNTGYSGSGGDGEGNILGAILFFLFENPIVGIPFLLLIVGIFIYIKITNGDSSTSSAIDDMDWSFDGPNAPNASSPESSKLQETLANIQLRDPNFNKEHFIKQVKRIDNRVQDAWSAGDMGPVRNIVSDGLFRRFETQLSLMKLQGIQNPIANHFIQSATIVGGGHDEHFDVLHVQINASCQDLEVSASLSREEAERRVHNAPSISYTEIVSFLRKPSALTNVAGVLEGKCPNCGAPLPSSQVTRCEHCEALVNSGEYDWVLSEITQLEEWRPQSTGDVVGLKQLTKVDGQFNRQSAEDRGSYLFWRWIEAITTGTIAPLSKVALPLFTKKISGSRPVAMFKVAVGSVDLVACETNTKSGRDKFHIKVLWSSANEPDGKCWHASNILTISRKSGSKDPGILSYAYCHVCQGPLEENDSPTCQYCGENLAAGENDWVLEQIISPEELKLEPMSANEEQPKPMDYLIPNLSDKRERTLLLMKMASVVMSDGVVSKAEKKLLKNASDRWKVPMETIDPILSGQVAPQVTATMKPKDPQSFIIGLIGAALVDGRIDRKEEKLLKNIGLNMGLAKEAISELIKEITLEHKKTVA